VADPRFAVIAKTRKIHARAGADKPLSSELKGGISMDPNNQNNPNNQKRKEDERKEENQESQ